jgi:acetyltransferase-like isoleucine patch superfamily enzyme
VEGSEFLTPSSCDVEMDVGCSIANSALVRGCGRLCIGPYSTVEDHVLLDLGQSGHGVIHLEARSKIKHGAILRTYNGEIRIGHRSSVGEYTVLAAHGGITVGAHVGIGPHCSFTASNHIASGDGVPFRYRGEMAYGISVEDDVWVAAGVRVLDGVTLGQGCVIGAGAVVSRSMPPSHLCVGVPCRAIRKLENSDPKEREGSE